jgi:outer membrane protein
MNKFHRLLPLCFFISSLFSQQVVKWDDVLKEAKEKNLQLKQTEISLQQTKLKIEKIKSEFYPRLNFSASSIKNYSKNFDSDIVYSYNLSLGIDLFNSFSTINNLRLQLVELLITQENFKRVYMDTVFSLKESFINLYFVQGNIALAEKILQRRKQNYELVKLKYESDSEDLGSLLRVEADMLQAEYELKKLQRKREVVIRQLLKILAKENFVDIKVETISELDEDIEKIINQDVADVIKQTPEYKIKQYQFLETQIQAKLAKSNFYPTVSFSANYGFSDTKPFPDKDKWNLSLSLRASYNIFNGFRDITDLKIANNNIKTAEFELENTKLNLVNNFYVLQNNYIDAKELLVVREKYPQALVV